VGLYKPLELVNRIMLHTALFTKGNVSNQVSPCKITEASLVLFGDLFHCLSHTASEIFLLVSRWNGSPLVSLLEPKTVLHTQPFTLAMVLNRVYGDKNVDTVFYGNNVNAVDNMSYGINIDMVVDTVSEGSNNIHTVFNNDDTVIDTATTTGAIDIPSYSSYIVTTSRPS
jgi:hypothetical protein